MTKCEFLEKYKFLDKQNCSLAQRWNDSFKNRFFVFFVVFGGSLSFVFCLKESVTAGTLTRWQTTGIQNNALVRNCLRVVPMSKRLPVISVCLSLKNQISAFPLANFQMDHPFQKFANLNFEMGPVP
jgi:hypothetical protein